MYGVILQVIRLLLDQGHIVWVCLAVGLSCLVLGCFLALSRLLKHKPFKLCVGGLNMVGYVADITLFFGWIPGAKVVLSLVSTVASLGNDHHWVFFRHCICQVAPIVRLPLCIFVAKIIRPHVQIALISITTLLRIPKVICLPITPAVLSDTITRRNPHSP